MISYNRALWGLSVGLVVAGCHYGVGRPVDSVPEPQTAAASCRAEVAPARGILEDAAHPCHAWVQAVAPRTAALAFGGSAALWTTCTQHKTALVVSAMHNFTWRFYNEDLKRAKYWDVNREGGAFVFVGPSGPQATVGELANGLWPLFTPEVPPTEWDHLRGNIKPRRDFFVAVVDGQQEPAEPDVGDGDSAVRVQRPFVTPAASSTGSATPGAAVLIAGYPPAELAEPQLVVSSGTVLSDAQARETLGALRAAGDEEGELAYEPGVEFLVDARAIPGMSGSGVFGAAGELLGVAVRGSSTPRAPSIVRVVRIDYIKQQLAAGDPKGKQKVRAFLEGSCDGFNAESGELAAVSVR